MLERNHAEAIRTQAAATTFVRSTIYLTHRTAHRQLSNLVEVLKYGFILALKWRLPGALTSFVSLKGKLGLENPADP
jgi:hypothetical protein